MRRTLMAVCACLGAAIGLSSAEAQIAASVNGVIAAQDVTGTFTLQRFVSDGDPSVITVPPGTLDRVRRSPGAKVVERP